MNIIIPEEITPSVVMATNVANDYANWSAGSYLEGTRAVVDTEVYEALSDTTDNPVVGAAKTTATWLRLGYTNKFRMFRDGTDSKTVQQDEIDVTLAMPGLINGIAVLGAVGSSVVITITDDTEGVVYTSTEEIADYLVDNWYDWFFLPYTSKSELVFTDLPAYTDVSINIVITALTGSDAQVGRIVLGTVADLGVALYGTSIGITSYSRKERDQFGNLTIVPRRKIKTADYDLKVETSRIDSLQMILEQVSDIPAVFIGSPEFGSLTIFGLYRDFNINISGPQMSDCSIDVEAF